MHLSDSRSGNALLLTMILLIVMASLASSLTELAVGNNKLREERGLQLKTLYAAESAANLGVGQLQNNWALYAAVFGADPTAVIELDIASYTMPEAKKYLDDERFRSDHINGFGEEQLRVWLSVITQKVTRSDDSSYTSPDPIDWQYKVEAFAMSHGAIASTVGVSSPVYRVVNSDPSNLVQVAYDHQRLDPEKYRCRRIEIAVYPAYLNNAEDGSIFSNALFALNGYDFMGAATTDSWHSGETPWQPGVSTGNGDLGSNGNIDVQKEQNVDGTAKSNMDMEVPAFDYDQLANQMGPSAIGPVTGGMSLSAGVYETSSLSLGGSPLVVKGDVVLFVDGPINFDAVDLSDGTLTIYQNKYDESQGSSSMNINGNTTVGAINDNGDGTYDIHPEKLVYITAHDGAMTMNGNGDMAGVIFAPDMTFKLNGTFDFYGGAISGAFNQGKVNGTFNFHYDEALSNGINLPDPLNNLTPKMVVTGWRSSSLGYGAELPY